MDLYGLMGNPVAHSKSPWIHARFAELTGEQLTYERRLVALDAFAEHVRAFGDEGGQGCNVTVPFKFEAAALADELSPRAALAGACNTLRFDDGRIYGDNTDGVGLVNDLVQLAGAPLVRADVLLVGAGGAAAGVLGPLIEAGPRRLVIANRTVDKAQALVDRHAEWAARHGVVLRACALDEIPGQFSVVVNATASSLAGASVPVAAHVLGPDALAYDMMYGPAAEGFLGWARSHGARARDGLGMLVEQAAESFLVWRGVRPPAGRVLAELRATL